MREVRREITGSRLGGDIDNLALGGGDVQSEYEKHHITTAD